MLVQRVLIFLWKYLLVKEEELFYWWKGSKFLLAALFTNARRVDVSKFRVENTTILRLRARKLIFLLSSIIKGFLREQLTSRGDFGIFLGTKFGKYFFGYAKTSCQKATNRYNTWNIANKINVRSSNECWPGLIQICNVKLNICQKAIHNSS